MSRLKHFAHSVLSGYVMIGANVLYTFASVPMALSYLNKLEFGLWALTMQIGGYIALIDLGMTGSVSRILIDYKDRRSDGSYGSLVKTGALVGGVQGALILLAGTGLAMVAGPLLNVPLELQRKFMWLVVGQSVLLAVLFGTRIFSHMLVAHQRYDILNYGQSAMFAVSLLAMWAGFEAGLGVFSFLVAQAIGTLSVAVVSIFGCVKLKLFPHAGEWGEATWEKFRELFVFGKDVFLYSIGMQFISTSQTILLTRFMGLDAAAVWTVCTRAYTLLTMLIWRILDFSIPGLAEMMARGERERLLKRFKELAVLCTSVSLAAGALLAACNSPFIQLWLHGKIHWSLMNDWLVAAWLVAGTTTRAHIMLAGATKRFAFLRYLYLVEGSVFVALNILLQRVGGITLMLILSILCLFAFSLPYGFWRTRHYFRLRWQEFAVWYGPVWRLSWRLIPIAIGVWWLTRNLPAGWQFAVNAGLSGLWALFTLLRYGLSQSLRADIEDKLPLRMRRVFSSVTAA